MHLLVQHTRKGRIHLRSGHAETTTRPSMRGCNLKIFNTRRKPNESVQRGDRKPAGYELLFPEKKRRQHLGTEEFAQLCF